MPRRSSRAAQPEERVPAGGGASVGTDASARGCFVILGSLLSGLTLSTLSLMLASMADDDTLVVIAAQLRPEEAGMLRGLLESEGIAAALLNNVSLSEDAWAGVGVAKWPCAHPRRSARVR